MRVAFSGFKPVLLHILAWLGFFAYEQTIFFLTDKALYSLPLIGVNYLLNAALFYLNSSLLLPRLYDRHRHWVGGYVCLVVGLLAAYGCLRCEINLRVAPALGLTVPGPAYSYGSFWVLAVYRGTFFQFASMGYWFARNALRVEQQKREQQQRLRVAEKLLLDAQLVHLKSQINPHFLFNSLNVLYALVYPHSENAAKGILLLADTMRYALQEENEGKAMLTHEVTHLRNYVALHQLRFHHRLQVDLKIVGHAQFLMIPPLVLVTFVENCFKHGELFEPTDPVRIHLTLAQNRLTFEARNKKRPGLKETSTGIGLANTRRRLDAAYPNGYSLRTDDGATHYTCTLNLTL